MVVVVVEVAEEELQSGVAVVEEAVRRLQPRDRSNRRRRVRRVDRGSPCLHRAQT